MLQQATRGYAKRDIQNTDETAYFYCTTPDKTMPQSGFPRRKKKETHDSGCDQQRGRYDNCPVAVHWHFASFSVLWKLNRRVAGLEYTNAAKGCMNSVVFQHWIERLNERMREEGRHILLLLDNVSSHRVGPPLYNITAQMLTPNSTSYLQPQDARVIQAFKSRLKQIKLCTSLLE